VRDKPSLCYFKTTVLPEKFAFIPPLKFSESPSTSDIQYRPMLVFWQQALTSAATYEILSRHL